MQSKEELIRFFQQRKNYFVNTLYRRKVDIPIYLFCHHKSGTILLRKVFTEICKLKGWKFIAIPGMVDKVPESYEVVLFSHSLIGKAILEKPFVGIHLIRDPRDIIISGYQYHLRTSEKWCINQNFQISHPIKYPKVPVVVEHYSEAWKSQYLQSLNQLSYQENLKRLSKTKGITFEMNNYSSWTINNILEWNYFDTRVLEIKFEEIMSNYDESWFRIFDFLDFSEKTMDSMFSVIKKHDLSSKSNDEISNITHVTSQNTRRWKQYFEKEHREAFINKYENALITLGYENSDDW